MLNIMVILVIHYGFGARMRNKTTEFIVPRLTKSDALLIYTTYIGTCRTCEARTPLAYELLP